MTIFTLLADMLHYVRGNSRYTIASIIYYPFPKPTRFFPGSKTSHVINTNIKLRLFPLKGGQRCIIKAHFSPVFCSRIVGGEPIAVNWDVLLARASSVYVR